MNRLKIYFFLLCLVFGFGKTNAQVSDKFDNALQSALDSMLLVLNINGLGAALQLSDGQIWAGGSGVSTFSPPDSITAEHTFAVASTTKTITAACILQLADVGELSLDDSLYHWLPSFNHIDSTITIRQLLRHQSGIYDVLLNPGFQPQLASFPNQIWTLENVITTFIQPPNFQAGAGWGYSNTNYLLLGMIIESVTGNAYYEEFKNRFFDPMGLESFSLPAFHPLPNEVAHLWLDITGDGIVDDAHFFFSNWKSFFSAVGPAGAYYASPTDMAIWMRTCMNGSMYSTDIWNEAQETVATGLPGGTGYGLGIMKRSYLGHVSFGHGGDVSYSSSVVYFPDLDISIAIHANDARVISWSLAPVVRALLQVYLDCADEITASSEIQLMNANCQLFPNPFSNDLTLSVDLPNGIDFLEYFITDMHGRKISMQNSLDNIPAGKTKIPIRNLDHLRSGIYWLHFLQSDNTSTVFKIIKID